MIAFRQFHFSKSSEKHGWNEGGVNGEAQFTNLFYCPTSGHVIAQFCSANLQSLYVRHHSENLYRKVHKENDKLSYADPIVDNSNASLFFNVMEAASGNAMNWRMVAKLDLKKNEIEPIFSESNYKANSETFWISRLYGMSPDNSKLICSASLTEIIGFVIWTR